jgi:hypothetical protein
MTRWDDMTGNDLWKDKAIAFLARSRKELWGKHNEDILAWFFKAGFRNRFIQDMLLGWNKRPKERPAENWGFSPAFSEGFVRNGNLFFPPGIVIPFVVDKHLAKLVIYDHESPSPRPSFTVPGSSPDPMVFGGKTGRIAVVDNILHALLLFQEFPENLTVVVPDVHDKKNPMDNALEPSSEFRILYFPDPLNAAESSPDIREPHTVVVYENSGELIEQVRRHFFQ